MLKKVGMLSIILLSTTAATCAPSTTETVRTVSDYCLIAKGITFSKKRPTQVETAANAYDTDETVKQVEEHDLAFERLCPSGAQQ